MGQQMEVSLEGELTAVTFEISGVFVDDAVFLEFL
jgi:hypothetical protein